MDTDAEGFEKMRIDQFRQIIETCDWVDGLSKHFLELLSDRSRPMSLRLLDVLMLDVSVTKLLCLVASSSTFCSWWWSRRSKGEVIWCLETHRGWRCR